MLHSIDALDFALCDPRFTSPVFRPYAYAACPLQYIQPPNSKTTGDIPR